MLILRTDQGVRRYCSYCKSPMNILKETDEVFSAVCPNRESTREKRCDSVLECKDAHALVAYALELFAPALNQGKTGEKI
jgi:hypothetical protein